MFVIKGQGTNVHTNFKDQTSDHIGRSLTRKQKIAETK